MKSKSTYFIRGVLSALAAVCLPLMWDSQHEYRGLHRLDGTDDADITHPELRPEDLVGTWHGQESFGVTFVITRASDGTFTELDDLRRSDVHTSKEPAFVKSKGRWSLHGKIYTLTYTESTNANFLKYGSQKTEISSEAEIQFMYWAQDGNRVQEIKQ